MFVVKPANRFRKRNEKLSLWQNHFLVIAQNYWMTKRKTSWARSHLASRMQTLWSQTSYQRVAERFTYLLRCCLVSLSNNFRPNNKFQKYGTSWTSRNSLSFSSPCFWKMWQKANFQIFLGTRNFNKEQRSVILLWFSRLQIHLYIAFSQNVDWNRMVIISLQMTHCIRNCLSILFFGLYS